MAEARPTLGPKNVFPTAEACANANRKNGGMAPFAHY